MNKSEIILDILVLIPRKQYFNNSRNVGYAELRGNLLVNLTGLVLVYFTS